MKGDRKHDKSDKGSSSSGDRYKGSSRGPSEEDRKKYESLSDKAKEKFRDLMRSKFSDEKFRNAPEEERRNVIRKEFERIEKEDKGGK
jgi:DNA-binding MarR family transcriptional regulator